MADEWKARIRKKSWMYGGAGIVTDRRYKDVSDALAARLEHGHNEHDYGYSADDITAEDWTLLRQRYLEHRAIHDERQQLLTMAHSTPWLNLAVFWPNCWPKRRSHPKLTNSFGASINQHKD